MDLDRALTDIRAVRSQMARGSAFRGYGPLTFALTAMLAIAASFTQGYALPDPQHRFPAYLVLWCGTAAIAGCFIRRGRCWYGRGGCMPDWRLR